jgi:hypothetical protein
MDVRLDPLQARGVEVERSNAMTVADEPRDGRSADAGCRSGNEDAH